MVPAINSSHCFTTFYVLASVSSNRAFCGGYENQARAPCLGYSGGEFYLREQSSKWNASLIDKFSIYTNDARFVEWIEFVVENTNKIVWTNVEFICKKETDL